MTAVSVGLMEQIAYLECLIWPSLASIRKRTEFFESAAEDGLKLFHRDGATFYFCLEEGTRKVTVLILACVEI